MHSTETVDYDAIHREAAALRLQAYADIGRALAAFFRRAPKLRVQPG